MKSKNYVPLLAGILYSAFFGFSFLFTKNTLDHITPFQLLGYRFALAALFFTLLQILNIIKVDFRGKKLKMLLLLGLVQPIAYFTFETTGINLTTSSEAGLFISVIPIFVVIFSGIFLGEKPARLEIIFVLLSVTGVIFITTMRGKVEIGNSYLGVILLMGAVISAAIYNMLSRKLSLSFSSTEITYVMMWSGAIFFNIISIIKLRNEPFTYFTSLASIEVLTGVIYLGVFSSVIAFFMLNYAIAHMDAIKAAVFANLTTVIAILAGIIFRGEPFYWFQIVGSMLIITGVSGTIYFGKKRKIKKGK